VSVSCLIRGGGGYTVLPLYVPPSKIFFGAFFSVTKFVWLKVASVDCEILLIAPFKKKKIVSSKDVYSLVSLIKVMTFRENHLFT
jgi:hypothetical protein